MARRVGYLLEVVRDARVTLAAMASLGSDRVPDPPCASGSGCVACDGFRLLARLGRVRVCLLRAAAR